MDFYRNKVKRAAPTAPLFWYNANMKFYVTGRSSNYKQVEAAFAHIKQLGHEVTFEWTSLPMVKPYSQNVDKAAEFAVAGIAGVVEADVYIFFTHHDGNGVFTEFGAALASNTLHGKPRICAIGADMHDAAMFYAHPAVEWFTDVEAVFAAVGV